MADDFSSEAVGLLRTLTATPSLAPKDREATDELVLHGLARRLNSEGTVQITEAGSRKVEGLDGEGGQ